MAQQVVLRLRIEETLKMKYLDLKCESFKFEWDRRTKNRLEQTEQFLIRNHFDRKNDSNLLCIGDIGEFDKQIAYRFQYNVLSTIGDLDFEWSIPSEVKYGAVIMFEVIEHLKNPALFLSQLKLLLGNGFKLFISYPIHPIFLKGERHFHEISLDSFYTLIIDAGYQIEDYQRTRLWSNWYFYLSGIRPIFRIVLTLFKLSSQNYFCLSPTKSIK